MATPDLIWQTLSARSWLIHPSTDTDQNPDLTTDQLSSSQAWADQVRDRQHHFFATPLHSPTPLLLLGDPYPPTFLATFLAALLSGWNIAIANPHWSDLEWQSAVERLNPDKIWGQNTGISTSKPIQPSLKDSEKDPEKDSDPSAPSTWKSAISEPTIWIPTSGSAGQIKFARHSWSSLMASVKGFCGYFAPNGEPINTYCVLPLYHVSGLMQILRAWVSGGQIALSTFKQLEHHWPLVMKPHDWYISLVPTQLERLMQSGKSDWLQQFRAILLGGAPPWPTLLHRAQSLPLRLSYGMTETAAMVTVSEAHAFATDMSSNGAEDIFSSGRALPHAKLQIRQGERICQPNEIGQVAIASAAVAQGYDGHASVGAASPFKRAANPAEKCFYTDDLGYLSADGQLYITGRSSDKIISGGENIFPAEIEAALRSTGQVQDVCVLGSPHSIWGEVVLAAYVPAHAQVSPDSLQQAIAPILIRYKQPKQWIRLSHLPRSAQGKINRQQLLSQIARSNALTQG